MGTKPSNIRKSIRVDIDDLMGGLERYGKRARKKVEAYLEESAREYRAYMRENKKWEDITSKARLSLNAKVENPKDGYYRIALSHGVYYGYYLEYRAAFGGKYAILVPTQKKMEPLLLESLRGLLN